MEDYPTIKEATSYLKRLGKDTYVLITQHGYAFLLLGRLRSIYNIFVHLKGDMQQE